MYNFLVTYQVHILIASGIFNLFLAFFVMVIQVNSMGKKKALIKMEVGTAIIMLAEAVYYMHIGNLTPSTIIVVRIANFIANIMLLANVYFLDQYLTVLFMEGGKYEKLPKRLLVSYMLPSFGLGVLVLNEFMGFIYKFDLVSGYQRGPLIFLAFIIPAIPVALMFSLTVENRGLIESKLYFSIVFFSALPYIAALAQLFIREIPFVAYATWQAAVAFFWFALVNQNVALMKAANTEIGTGLPNANGYMHEVDKIIHFHDITEYNGYYFDIVRMGQINNRLGKVKGDKVIYDYAMYIRKSLGSDEILGRLGGNFFVALVKKSNTEKFINLLRDVPVEIEVDGKTETLHMAAVAGGYKIDRRVRGAGEVIGNCAVALSYAKNVVHKPYVFLDEHLEMELLHLKELEESIRKALRNNAFDPYYQPKVDSEKNELCGAEALVRWTHEGKVVYPSEFVPIMERNGSICELDLCILERVCQDIKDWIDRGIDPVPVSVNFSRRNLSDDLLVEKIVRTIEKYEIPKRYIQIEVTETLDEYPMEDLYTLVEKLHIYGISSAIDDFGTKSSSIKLMKEVPFDVLKIDKTFVDYETFKEKQLLYDIIHMAENIGIEVIAEGVEKQSQIEELKKMGCTIIQGFVYDRAMDKEKYEQKLINKSYVKSDEQSQGDQAQN